MSDRRLLAFAATVALVAAALVAAVVALRDRGGDARGRPAGATVGLAHTRLGRVLVGPDGRTLYAFLEDRPASSRCYDACARVWPPLIVPPGGAIAGAGVGRLGETRRRDGREQVVYHGHPLYTVASDTRRGQVTGQAFAGTWFVVSAGGRPLTAGATPARTY